MRGAEGPWDDVQNILFSFSAVQIYAGQCRKWTHENHELAFSRLGFFSRYGLLSAPQLSNPRLLVLQKPSLWFHSSWGKVVNSVTFWVQSLLEWCLWAGQEKRSVSLPVFIRSRLLNLFYSIVWPRFAGEGGVQHLDPVLFSSGAIISSRCLGSLHKRNILTHPSRPLAWPTAWSLYFLVGSTSAQPSSFTSFRLALDRA